MNSDECELDEISAGEVTVTSLRVSHPKGPSAAGSPYVTAMTTVLHDVNHTLLALDISQVSRTRVMGNFVYTRKESRAFPASIDT